MLAGAVESYLAVRRAAGFSLTQPARTQARRMAANRTLMVEGTRLFCSRKNLYRSTTVRLKANRGSEQYQPMNSSIAWP